MRQRVDILLPYRIQTRVEEPYSTDAKSGFHKFDNNAPNLTAEETGNPLSKDNFKEPSVKRERVELSSVHLQPLHAHMYVGIREFWQDLVKSPNFSPVHYIEPNNPKLGKLQMNNYYYFKRMEVLENQEISAPYIGKHVEAPFT